MGRKFFFIATGTVIAAIGGIQLAIGFLTDFHWGNLIHALIFITTFSISIYFGRSIVTWAIFPYSNSLVAHLHKQDVNM
jgi:hypothetical protein